MDRPRPADAPTPDFAKRVEGASIGDRTSLPALLFALCFAGFLLLPPLLGQPFAPFPVIKAADVLDLLTPLVLMPLYWLLVQSASSKPISAKETAAFLLLVALWVEGQGMHLAANSISHHLSLDGGTAYAAAYFYDEVLSHYLWHLASMGLSAMVMWRQWQAEPTEGGSSPVPLGLSALLYGFTYFAMIVEGQTTSVGVPFAAIAALGGMAMSRRQLGRRPLLTFFVGGYLVATVLFAAWGLYWGAFPQFSKVGLVD